MKIKLGTTRIAIIFPMLGIVIKIPRIRVIVATRLFLGFFKCGSEGLKNFLNLDVESSQGFKSFLFGGFYANFMEYKFYLKTHNPFLQPTFLSFGFLNIQKLGEPHNMSDNDIWSQMLDITHHEVCSDPHTFVNRNNYCIYNGTLRILDYGNSRAQKIISQFGKEIVERFDIHFAYKNI